VINVNEVIAAIAEISRDDLPAIMLAIAARMTQQESAPELQPWDELLDAPAAAGLIGVSPSWLYHRPKLPFRVKVGGKLKFRRAGIERWLKHRQGAA